MDDLRWGVSLIVPGGLTKRWETPYQKASAEEFTLKIIELSPSIAYKITDNFSVAGGVRIIYSEGVVKSDTSDIGGLIIASRDMEGDTVEFGYNLALAYRPTPDINFAVTYRSNVNLKEEGNAKLFANFVNPSQNFYDGDASVTVPLPATLNIAISKTWNERFTLEFDYERAFWSKYKNLDFEYDTELPVFDEPLARNWKDVNIFRLGATVKMDNKLTALFGFSIDDSPTPQETIGFELPDSDSKNFSMGFKYQQNANLSWGASFLYSSKEAITLQPGAHEDKSETNLLNKGGGFSEGGAFLTTVGVAYEF
jgi:long-chain fatty acid transport protein